MVYRISTDLANTNEKVYIYESDKQKIPLNSLYSPEKEIERFLKKLAETKKQFVILIGFGNGKLLEKILESEIFEQNIHFLFIEPFIEVELSEFHRILLSKTNKISFLYADNLTSILFADFLSKFIGIGVTIQFHPNYMKLNELKVKKILEVINEGIETKQVINNTEIKFAKDWILEPIANINSISNSINLKELQGKFKGERALLIASGPSLNTHMDFIRENQEGFYLFALGPSLRALLTNDIVPDYTLSIDSSAVNYETHFSGLEYNGTLIYETVSNSYIQKNHKGPLIAVKSPADHITSSIFPNLVSFEKASPSVAVFTLQVINYLGFSEVYFVGQDLALIDGNYYAKGIKQHDGSKNVKQELTVEDNQGKQVGTTQSLKIFLETFEYVIKNLRKDLKLFNLSTKGAKIEGVRFIEESMVKTNIEKKIIDIQMEDRVLANIDPDIFFNEFVLELRSLKKDVNVALTNLNRYLKMGVANSKDMEKILKEYRKITGNKVLEEILLSYLTFLFKRITNTFKLMDNKKNYLSKDLLEIIKELDRFYSIIFSFSDGLLKDNRLNR
ncbi:6-hydroxymethylpterin diphosphokinase MptE-like protein [Psychrobacillus sp. FSL K6-4046]|uniref:motility associated factor glycosyltransferase family protein n=1 Tax=Psychrobacillus sp. FSL K6-4046 TaxID=2921550 RepID=UPI00315A0302